VRVSITEEIKDATPHRNCQQGKDDVTILSGRIAGGGCAAAVGSKSDFIEGEALKARLEIRAVGFSFDNLRVKKVASSMPE